MNDTRYKDELISVFDRNADVYDRSGMEFFTPIGRRLVELAGIRPGEEVLDVGCGRGACLYPAVQATGDSGHVTGIDLSTVMIDRTRQEIHQRGHGNASVQVMDAEEPRFADGSFDAILGSFSFILLPDPPAALRRYPPLLRRGGRLAFSGPAVGEDSRASFLPTSLTGFLDTAREQFFPAWAPQRFVNTASSWLAGRDRVTATLTECGFPAVEIHDEPHRMTMRSGEDWIRWSWTNGMRLIWEQTPAETRTRLQASIIAELDSLRDEEGTITLVHPVRYVIAHPAK